MTKFEFYSLARTFLEGLALDLNNANVQLGPHWDIDHLCYRADTVESYEKLKKNFSDFGELLIESEVNGRLIATYKLYEAVSFYGWKIQLVELPSPKKGKITPPGFEHIEVVCDVPFSELLNKYNHLELDPKGLTKDFNKELEIILGARNIKFHHLSLESVINVEKNVPVFNAIKKSKILQHFSDSNPLLAGTFPLDIQVQNSDVDILLLIQDLNLFKTRLSELYGRCEGFKVSEEIVDGLQTLICHFIFDGVPFEVFAQDREPVLQMGYRHFLIEERLLKKNGPEFMAKIKFERANGLKTEPAFAKVLGLAGDPYQALLEMLKVP